MVNKSTSPEYTTTIEPVFEVTLTGTTDSSAWEQILASEAPHISLDAATTEVVLSATRAKFMGMAFQEFSISLLLDTQRAFLLYAFNSNPFFAYAERRFFRTPYYHAKITVESRRAHVVAGDGSSFEVALPQDTPVSEPIMERQTLKIELPQSLRKRANTSHYFHALLEGETRHYTTSSIEMVCFEGTMLPALAALSRSNFQPHDWIVRTSARHGKSKTQGL
ncbi:MAG: hypothetical protein MUF38_08980 [Anaerolineae bacterium]|nr:hypothetical protein [Anaerolineae bacterium]